MTAESLNQFTKSLREQIAQGEIELALGRLQNYLSSSAPALRDEIVLLTARYNRIRRESRKGIISRDTAQADENRLVASLLELIEEVPDEISDEMSESRKKKSS